MIISHCKHWDFLTTIVYEGRHGEIANFKKIKSNTSAKIPRLIEEQYL